MIREDLKLSNKLLSLYNKIDYFNRYKKLSSEYRTNEDGLEKTDKKLVLPIFEKLGYKVKYKARESFYQILEKKEGIEFYFHVSLKYGLVELIFGVLKTESGIEDKENIGGTASGVCRLIEINRTKTIEGNYIKDPVFKSYEELEEILKESFSLYEDFKKEVFKLYK